VKSERLSDIKRFYKILDILGEKVGEKRILANCNGKMNWPLRGVYFFFEPGELRTTSGSGLRVVRVGTHALKSNSGSTLWQRLRQHRGALTTGGGNHRGSVFRLHVGAALIQRDHWTTEGAQTWGHGSSAKKEIRQKEFPIEQAVSKHIRRMPFLWLPINDEPGPDSKRGYIERNAIALLSNYRSRTPPVDPPGEDWLGNFSASEQIRDSGLWNVNHIGDLYTANFLNVLEDLVKKIS
jgi:hypothetical protein